MPQPTQPLESEFDSLLNFRDVATIVNINPSTEHSLTQGRIYRSARPDSISQADKQTLQNVTGIKTIIDLRSKTEHIEAAKKFTSSAHLTNSSIVPASNEQIASTFKIQGIKYAEINLNGRGFERHLVWQLSYSNLARLTGYMLLGYRLAGISIIGKNVLQPRGLIGLGKDTLQHSGPEIKQVFDVLADKHSYPLLLHCTQGKDRTGLIVVLVLLLCDVNIDAITHDYTLSEQELKPEFEERMKEIKSIGLDQTFAMCPAEFVPEIAAFIVSTYGSIRDYLISIGVNVHQQELVRNQLLR